MDTKRVLSQIEENIQTVIAQDSPLGVSLLTALEKIHPADIADFLTTLDDDPAAQLFNKLPKKLERAVFEEFSDPMRAFILTALDEQGKIEILNTLAIDKLTDLFDHFSDEDLKTYLKLLHKEARDQVLSLLQFDPESAGGIMTTDIFTLMPDFTVDKCIALLQRLSPSRDVHQQIYVVDRSNYLLGFINLEDLVLQKPTTRIGNFMHKNELIAHAQEDRETIANKMVHYGVMTVPVVDDNNLFLGVIPSDTLVDVLVEEATEDVQKMSALAPLKDSYFETPFVRIFYERGSILVILLIAGSVSSVILHSYEGIFAGSALLYSLPPMLTSTGGNTSSQTSAIVIQGIATGDISIENALRFLRRELLMALLLGLFLGAVAFARVYVTSGAFWESVVASCTVSIIVITSVVLGSCIPIILKRFKIDPAFSAGPFLATIMDILGVLIFCLVIRLIL